MPVDSVKYNSLPAPKVNYPVGVSPPRTLSDNGSWRRLTAKWNHRDGGWSPADCYPGTGKHHPNTTTIPSTTTPKTNLLYTLLVLTCELLTVEMSLYVIRAEKHSHCLLTDNKARLNLKPFRPEQETSKQRYSSTTSLTNPLRDVLHMTPTPFSWYSPLIWV